MNLFEPDQHPIRSALWAGLLAVVDRLPKETAGSSRSTGEFTDNGEGGSAMRTTFSVSQPDGTRKIYELTASVVESVDSIDRFWGPGGPRDQDDPARRVVIDSEHYLIGDDKPGDFKGFGGRRFDIEFTDGRRVTTRNLWCQGTVPPKWRERFPDNARFGKGGVKWPANASS